MQASVVSELPAFDTGQYKGCEFAMSSDGATLTLHVAELPPLSFHAYATLRHYRIFLDETGCHEVFAESVAAL